MIQTGLKPGKTKTLGRVNAMDIRLSALMQGLRDAINESLAKSPHVAEAIAAANLAGYDVFLVLETSVGWNKSMIDLGHGSKRGPDTSMRIKWTAQDQKFLRALKIAIDDRREDKKP